MKHSSLLLPFVGATLLNFSVASAQQAPAQETKPVKEGAQITVVHSRQVVTAKAAANSTMAKNVGTSTATKKSDLKSKKPAVTKRSATLAKASKQTGKKTTAHASVTETSRKSSKSAQHVKHSIKNDQSKTQKKSRS
jgi:hypothetical protein